MRLRVSRTSGVPLCDQLAAQLELFIATGELAMGEQLPSVRTLARLLRVHHNTVSHAYHDLVARNLLERQPGRRLVVNAARGSLPSTSALDGLLDEVVRLARQGGASAAEVERRLADRFRNTSIVRVVVVSEDAGMRRLLAWEVRQIVGVPVTTSTPAELSRGVRDANALVVVPPGLVPAVKRGLSKPATLFPIAYSTAQEHLAHVEALAKPSVISVASISAEFLAIARGVLAPLAGSTHEVEVHLVRAPGNRVSMTADVLFCDALVYALPGMAGKRSRIVPYSLIAPECAECLRSWTQSTMNQSLRIPPSKPSSAR